jgi:hypothetical protein
MSPNNKGSSGLSNIMKTAGNSTLNDQERIIKFPMDPRTAVINYSKYLQELEKTEILDYDIIYWFGLNERKV